MFSTETALAAEDKVDKSKKTQTLGCKMQLLKSKSNCRDRWLFCVCSLLQAPAFTQHGGATYEGLEMIFCTRINCQMGSNNRLIK